MNDDTDDKVVDIRKQKVVPVPCETPGYGLNNVELPDMVNSPSHYKQGKIETIDIIEQIVSHYPPEMAYSIGAVVKYICRAPHKGTRSLDLKKAEWYLKRVIKQCKQS